MTSEKFNLRIDDKADLAASKEFQIKLEFKKVMLGKLYDYYLDDELQILEDKIRVHFSSSSIEETATYLLRFHGNVVILEPDELKQEYTRIVQKINNSLNDDI